MQGEKKREEKARREREEKKRKDEQNREGKNYISGELQFDFILIA
jgi:hypothetical protein